MSKNRILAALSAAFIVTAAPHASLAQTGAGIPAGPAVPLLGLSLGPCVQGTTPIGVARFRNVGRNDRNEGAPNTIAIRLCSVQPDLGLTLTESYCEGRTISRKSFQNVANTDLNEGAPNRITISLCVNGRVPGAFRLARRSCPAGFGEISAVRFQNVGNSDFNEGAPNFISILLCAGR